MIDFKLYEKKNGRYNEWEKTNRVDVYMNEAELDFNVYVSTQRVFYKQFYIKPVRAVNDLYLPLLTFIR